MDGWKSTGKSSMPQLVVKIVGGKQIKYFIEGTKSPADHLEVISSSEERHSPPDGVTDGDLNSPSRDLEPLGPVEQTESLLEALRKVPDRLCVTAPCGDRSRSYIDLKSTANLAYSKLQTPHITGAEVHYKELLQFIQRAVHDEEEQSVEVCK